MNYEYQEPIIYLINGQARHGKTTTLGFMKDYYAAKNIKLVDLMLAQYLKYYAMKATNWQGSDHDKPRTFLQQVGTELIRQKLNKPTFHVDRTIEDIKILSYFVKYFVIDDVRLVNEIEKMKQSFTKIVTIHINRPEFTNELDAKQKQHLTEQKLEYAFDYYLENKSLDGLKTDIIKIMEEVENEKFNKQ